MKMGDLVKIKGNLWYWLQQSNGETGRITEIDTKPDTGDKRTWHRVLWPHMEGSYPEYGGYIYLEEDLEIIKLGPLEPDFTLDEIETGSKILENLS